MGKLLEILYLLEESKQGRNENPQVLLDQALGGQPAKPREK